METPKIKDKSIPKKLGRYEIHEPIGSGGMGMIFKGFDTKLKRPVAMKMISDKVKDESVRSNIRERFLNEARAAGALSHPNLVQIYDFGDLDEITFIVMEFIEGETLEQLLKSKGPSNLQQLFQITKEIGSGLSFAHKRGIIHRDIKPSNIIIEADTGMSKILDFGIAKFVDEEDMKLTSTGMVLGSTHYLSPEHITGRDLDGRSDIFCLGTLLYEASTGVLPFRGSNSSTILYKIVHFDPPPPHEVRPQLEMEFSRVIMKCLQKNPKDRYQRSQDLVDAIGEIEDSFRKKTDPSGSHSGEVKAFQQSYYVRDSQLITSLQTHKKITAQQAARYRGKAAYPLIVRDSLVTEEDMAAIVAECLNLPWIPKGRLKSLKVDPEATKLLDLQLMQTYHVLPFYVDHQHKKLSMLIDGVTDFQKDPDVLELFRQFEVKIYVSGRNTLARMIELRGGAHGATGEVLGGEDFVELQGNESKRVLLLEPKENAQSALLSLFQGNESSLVICSTAERAQEKIKAERFNHIWLNRSLVGDELAFESAIIKSNPSCDVRFYDHLGQELFEDSIHYSKFKDFFIRIVELFMGQGTPEIRKLSEDFATLAVRVARAVTENRKELDEVYFSALFYKWEKLRTNSRALSDYLYGVYRLRHIKNCYPERFDGRGPMGLKAHQIPAASRVITCLSIVDKLNPKMEPWSAENLKRLQESYHQYSGKQLDPVITAQVLEIIQPQSKQKARASVVIVDADEQFAKELQAHLKRVQIQADVFVDAREAFKQIQSKAPSLIITEVSPGGLDGFSLLTRLKTNSQLKDLPVVFISNSQHAQHSTKAIQLGAEDFISKSNDIQFLIAKLEKIIS